MKNNIMSSLLLITALLFMSPLVHAEIQLKFFNTESYKTIITQYQGNAFLMVLWSVDCPPCIDELPALGKFHQSHPTANIVMVSTDRTNLRKDIKHLISKHGLSNIQQWIFSDASTQALRFTIDPLWYGELPRSYFHNSKHKRQAKSGKLNGTTLLAWIKTVNNQTTGL